MNTHKERERWTPLTRIFLADKPSVKIVRVDGGSVLEDGISSLSLSCISESNPPAQVEIGSGPVFLNNYKSFYRLCGAVRELE